MVKDIKKNPQPVGAFPDFYGLPTQMAPASAIQKLGEVFRPQAQNSPASVMGL